VYVVRDGKLLRRTVKLLRSEGESVIVSGLEAGDPVVVSRLDLMTNGMAVDTAA
jgi:3-dehydroquinate synthase class II